MKLSYFTGNWPDLSWNEHCNLAESMGLGGIELRYSAAEAQKFLDGTRSNERQQFLRRLGDNKLSVPCITVSLSSAEAARNASMKNAADCILLASALHAPYVCLDFQPGDGDGEEQSVAMIGELLPLAETEGVILLLETKGPYADTSALCRLLDRFACDNLAALWNLHDPFVYNQESPDATIKNLGAYVKHVHVSDSEQVAGAPRPCLVGDGVVPMPDMAAALRSIDYSASLSLVYRTEDSGLNDPDIVLPHYVNIMNRFIKVRERGDKYFENKRKTGKFIWPKDELIDLTFSEVLDRITEEFPDQYAFRYTTLDYTRTYAEFKEDVDTFARALVALGVKPGDKVATWATKRPPVVHCLLGNRQDRRRARHGEHGI